ncbi:MAG TPA: hypothetical protein VGB28_06050 [Actinomycetota bacterium]|jgi:hypothetical protein
MVLQPNDGPRDAFTEMAGRRLVEVRGTDARSWLHDLLTADVEELEPGRSSVALLLSPTGRIRAVVGVAGLAEGFLLIQAPDQPAPIDALLAPYVLSSNVGLADRSDDLRLFAVAGEPGRLPGAAVLRPSALTWVLDLLVDADRAKEVRVALEAEGLREVDATRVEAWRIGRGLARFPADLTPDSLPHEASFGEAIDLDKGCYLGQEAVAKVRNLGHPPWVLRAMEAPEPVEPGTVLRAGTEDAGAVTSSAPAGEGEGAVLARIRWVHRDRALQLPDGTAIGPGREAAGMA